MAWKDRKGISTGTMIMLLITALVLISYLLVMVRLSGEL